MIPRSSLLLADIGNGSAAMACFKSATRAALSESSRSTVTIYKGTKCRLSCCHLVQGDHRSGLSQRPGGRSTPTHRSPGHYFGARDLESNRARHPDRKPGPTGYLRLAATGVNANIENSLSYVHERMKRQSRTPHRRRSGLVMLVQAAIGPCGGGSSLGPDRRRVCIGNADAAAGLFGRAPLSRT